MNLKILMHIGIKKIKATKLVIKSPRAWEVREDKIDIVWLKEYRWFSLLCLITPADNYIRKKKIFLLVGNFCLRKFDLFKNFSNFSMSICLDIWASESNLNDCI